MATTIPFGVPLKVKAALLSTSSHLARNFLLSKPLIVRDARRRVFNPVLVNVTCVTVDLNAVRLLRRARGEVGRGGQNVRDGVVTQCAQHVLGAAVPRRLRGQAAER